MNELIKVGDQTYIYDGGEEFGAVREVSPDGSQLVVKSVHSGKVILDYSRLDRRIQKAIDHAHDAEKPGI